MANANVKTFTDANFQSEVLNSDVPVLVDFWAEWCGPCKALGPTIDQLADQFVGKAKVGKIDIDTNQNIAVQLGIQSIPTVMIFKGGQLKQKFVGLQGKPALAAALEAASV